MALFRRQNGVSHESLLKLRSISLSYSPLPLREGVRRSAVVLPTGEIGLRAALGSDAPDESTPGLARTEVSDDVRPMRVSDVAALRHNIHLLSG